MKKTLLGIIVLAALASSPAMAQEESVTNINCPNVIVDNFETRCIDGYEWLVKFERYGCMTYTVPVAQKFAIWPKNNGKPKMMLPVACTVEE